MLDEVQSPDLDVLHVMQALAVRGVLRRIPRAALVTRLGERRSNPDAPRAGAPVGEGRVSPGLRGSRSPRLLTGSLRWQAAILRIEDAIPPLDSVPSAPVPHLMATLRFGESVELGVMGLPVVGRFAPLWALTLPSLGAVVSTSIDRVPGVRRGMRRRRGPDPTCTGFAGRSRGRRSRAGGGALADHARNCRRKLKKST